MSLWRLSLWRLPWLRLSLRRLPWLRLRRLRCRPVLSDVGLLPPLLSGPGPVIVRPNR